jgi:hypothetical protein
MDDPTELPLPAPRREAQRQDTWEEDAAEDPFSRRDTCCERTPPRSRLPQLGQPALKIQVAGPSRIALYSLIRYRKSRRI